MKKEQLVMIMGFVAAAMFMASRKVSAKPAGYVGEIFPDGDTNGWRYFENGTAISPDGTYYQNGQMVWNPMS